MQRRLRAAFLFSSVRDADEAMRCLGRNDPGILARGCFPRTAGWEAGDPAGKDAGVPKG